MRRFLLSLAILGVASASLAGPLAGPSYQKIEVPAGHVDAAGNLEPGRSTQTVECRGGERVVAIAIGDHKPVVQLGITVLDKNNNIVAQDIGTDQAPDYVAVAWYPPRDGPYKIIIRSAGREYNAVRLSLK